MSAPANELAFDLGVARRAAQHWNSRTSERQKSDRAVRNGRLDQADSKERVAKRLNRLLGKVREAVPAGAREALPAGVREAALSRAREALPGALEEFVDRERVAEGDISGLLVERVIGASRDFLSVQFLEQALTVSRSVGRIVRRLGGGRVSFGTGFLVSPRLLMTNHHVLGVAEHAAASAVEFDFQSDRFGQALAVQRFRLDPAAFFLADEDLDFALVAVGEGPPGRSLADYGHCPLIAEEGKILVGEPINIIQHPKGEAKQIVVRENRLLDLPGHALDRFAHYEADTEPGSSGSPVFNDQWEVVALHHSGVPRTNDAGELLDTDGNVWRDGDDPTRLDWVANEGIRVSRLVAFIAETRVREHERRLRDELLAAAPPGPRPRHEGGLNGGREPGPTEAAAPPVAGLRPAAVTFTIPLSVTVSLGAAEPASAAEGARIAVVGGAHGGQAPLEAITPDRDYAARPGYDPDFLGFPVLLPKLTNTARAQAARVEGGGFELKYHHFSVVMNAERRLAFVAAVNLDAEAPFVHQRAGGDRWFFDPRIPEEVQAGDEHYRDNPLDRGHLVRRADAAWGRTPGEAKLANDDTFHFTNCSPQHQVFNQSSRASDRGLLLWGNLENHIAEQAARDGNKRLCVFNGPVFRPDDRTHRGLPVPREYWKVVAFEGDDGSPRAVGFVLSQEGLIRNLPAEQFEVGDYQPFQVKLRDLEARTRLDFGRLREHDPLEADGRETLFESGTEAVPLRRLRDIVT